MAQEPSKTSIRFLINDVQTENTIDNTICWNFPVITNNTPTASGTAQQPSGTAQQPSVTLPPFASIQTMPQPRCVTPVHTVSSPPQTATNCVSPVSTLVHKPATPTSTSPTTSSILSRKTPASMISRVKKSPYYTDAYMNWTFENLRAQHYCKALNDAEADSQRFYQCVFSPSCDRKMKGKGNLRRHIEWHLKKVEQDARCRGNVLLPEEYKKLKTNGFIEQQKKTELQRIRMEQRNILQRQLHLQLQQLVQS